MNANLDELLREGMQRFTADLHAPANLADRARRHRSHRLALRTAAASAAAAIAIAAIAVGAVSAGDSHLSGPAGPVEQSDVEQVRLTGPGPAYPEMIWSYGESSRQLITSAAGRPREDDGERILGNSHGSLTFTRTIVEFSSKTWARARVGPFSMSGRVAPTCAQPELGWPDSPASLPRWIRSLHKAMDCGAFAIAGATRIHGVEAIKLVGTGKLDPSLRSSTIWIKRADDVPVLMTGGDVSGRAEISWLRPTSANLALVQVPIPDGFRRVGIRDFPNAILPPVDGCYRHREEYVCTLFAYQPG